MNGLLRRLRRGFCSLLPALGIAGAGPAAALSLTPVSVSSYTEAYTCSAFRCERNGVTGAGNQTAYAPNTSATATLKWGAAPVITTTSTADLQTGAGSGPDPVSSRSGASMTLIYQMQLQGPSSISLPVVMHTSGQLKLTGSNLDGEVGFATLSLKILGDQNGAMNPIYREYLHISSRDIGPTGTLTLPFDDSKTFNMGSNLLYEVQMFVSSITQIEPGQGPVNSGMTSLATLDPLFEIDPTFAAAYPDYRLVFSSGAPVSTVPQPPSAALLSLGLLAMGGVRRWRRSTTDD